MPYVDTEWAVLIEGVLPGNEVWSNRWTVAETDVSSDIADALVDFYTLYTAWAGLMDGGWQLTTIYARNLVTSVVQDYTFVPVAGGATGDPLPTECAIRVSLAAAPNRHGGPYIAGFSATFTDGNGQLVSTEATNMRNGFNALIVDLATSNFELRLDSPTDTETKALTSARIGRTFDVIRKRRNNVPEGYLNVTL